MNSKDSCNVSEQGNCLVGIEYGTGSQQFLVITSIPERVDWGENVRVSLICDQRGWAYAVVILVPLSVIIGLIVAVVLGIVCCCKCSSTTESANIEMPRSDCNPDPLQLTQEMWTRLRVTSTLTLLQIRTRLRVISTLTLRPTIKENLMLTKLTRVSTRIIFLRTILLHIDLT